MDLSIIDIIKWICFWSLNRFNESRPINCKKQNLSVLIVKKNIFFRGTYDDKLLFIRSDPPKPICGLTSVSV